LVVDVTEQVAASDAMQHPLNPQHVLGTALLQPQLGGVIEERVV